MSDIIKTHHNKIDALFAQVQSEINNGCEMIKRVMGATHLIVTVRYPNGMIEEHLCPRADITFEAIASNIAQNAIAIGQSEHDVIAQGERAMGEIPAGMKAAIHAAFMAARKPYVPGPEVLAA